MSDRRQEIASALDRVRQRIDKASEDAGRNPEDITLIAVTKNFPISDVEILYELGERNFGENRDQEGREKSVALPDDVIWHFQGQIQSKKFRSITGWANLVHSLDEIRHARKIAEFDLDHPFPVLVQVSLDAPELREGRGGVSPEGLLDFLDQACRIPAIDVRGLMAVAPLDEIPSDAFARLAEIRAQVLSRFPQVSALSCGMSGDFEAAIAAGATHIRIGSSILGSR